MNKYFVVLSTLLLTASGSNLVAMRRTRSGYMRLINAPNSGSAANKQIGTAWFLQNNTPTPDATFMEYKDGKWVVFALYAKDLYAKER